MKKLLILFFLPLLVFGQPIEYSDTDVVFMEVQMEIIVQVEHEIGDEWVSQNLTILKNLRIPITNNAIPKPKTTRGIPKHLNTLSLSDRPILKQQSFAPQKGLDLLLAMNDQEFPKEDTLLKGLSPIRYNNYRFGGPENMPEGFGPKITL